ncbi:hypothetical protein GCM10009753_70930 [Streptantibioticus ferralitis]
MRGCGGSRGGLSREYWWLLAFTCGRLGVLGEPGEWLRRDHLELGASAALREAPQQVLVCYLAVDQHPRRAVLGDQALVVIPGCAGPEPVVKHD